MSLIKIYQGQMLQTALSQIVSSVQVEYSAFDEPDPDLLAGLADLQAATAFLTVKVNQASTLAADQVVVRAETGRELIFLGAPIGLEMAALVSAVIVAGRGDSGLALETRQVLADLTEPVHLQVFTTPT